MIAFITFALLAAVAWGKPADLSRNPMINEGLFEGDIMGIDPNADRNAIPHDSQRWPNGVVPYTIDPSSNYIRDMILKAMNEIEGTTCIRFVPRTSQHKDYIRIFHGEGCWSYLGCLFTGQQDLSLGNGCEFHGTVVHELLHALGFDHEHNRSDRDTYLNIIWANIEEKWQYAFKKLAPHENRLFAGFDFDSIMLYGESAFSKAPGLKTMVPVGQYRYMPEPYDKKGLSSLDITKVKGLYKC